MKHPCPTPRRTKVRRLAATLALVATAACGDPAAATVNTEILRELQALRTAITDHQGVTHPRDLDRQLLDTAMQPLREVLQGLVTEQASLRDRQITLAGELGRWSALVAAGTSPEGKDELTALRARLEKMEGELRQQDARHRDVQELLRKALDTTADRLGDFLLRLEGKPVPGGTGPAAPVEPGKGAVDRPAGTGTTGNTYAAGSDWLRPGYERRGPGGELLTILLLVIGIIAAGLLAWRLWREGAAHRQQPAPEHALAGMNGARAASEPTTGWEAVELLAASLADHVERVETATRVVERRQTSPLPLATATGPESATGPATAAEPEPELEVHDTIVLANEDEAVWQLLGVSSHNPATPQAEAEVADEVLAPAVQAEVAPGPQASSSGPVWLTADLALAGEEAARACLQREVRVLRRPAPVFTRHGDHLHVELAVLPDLPTAERSQILQRLLRAAPPAPRPAGKNGSRTSAEL